MYGKNQQASSSGSLSGALPFLIIGLLANVAGVFLILRAPQMAERRANPREQLRVLAITSLALIEFQMLLDVFVVRPMPGVQLSTWALGPVLSFISILGIALPRGLDYFEN